MLSVTNLSSYEYCPRKIFLEKVLKIRAEVPKPVLVKGTIRHEAYEKVIEGEKEIVCRISEGESCEDIMLRYKQAYSNILQEIIRENKYKLKEIEMPLQEAFKEFWPALLRQGMERAELVSSFARKNNLMGIELWRELTPKLKAEYRVESSSIGLRGIVDQLEIYESEMIPVEIKTGKAPKEGVWPGHRLQIGAYLLLLREAFLKVGEGVVHYVDSDKRVKITLNPFLRDDILEKIKIIKGLLNAQEIPARVSHEKKCKACGLHDQCYDDNIVKKEADKVGIDY